MANLYNLDVESVRGVLSQFKPKTDIKFPYLTNLDNYNIVSCKKKIELPDDQLFPLIEKTLGLQYETHGKRTKTHEQYRQWVLSLRDDVCYEDVNWPNITDRTFYDLEHEIAGITKRINSEKGKIVILGNGVSPVCVSLAQRFKESKLCEAPVIVDLFNHVDLYDDLKRLQELFLAQGVESPDFLKTYTANAQSIAKEIDNGNLVSVVYFVGSRNPPEQLNGASLVVNCFGPSSKSLEEQLSLLSHQGEFYTNICFQNIPDVTGFVKTPLKGFIPSSSIQSVRGTKIRRKR